MTARAYISNGIRRGEGTFFKDPNSVEDYQIIWPQLNGVGNYFQDGIDSIQTSAWNVPAGLAEVKSSFNSQSATVWISGGTNGVNYELTNTVTTSMGRTFKQSITIRVKTQ